MCSVNDIEDFRIDKPFGNISVQDESNLFTNNYDKFVNFFEDFHDLGKDCNSVEKIEKAFNITKKKHRINPSKNQLRYVWNDKFYSKESTNTFKRYLIKKGTRSESGVLVATITLSPSKFSCSKNCYYCPQEYDLEGKPSQPRSYMSSEPAMRRANRYNFDVMGQFHDRIYCYLNTGNINKNDKSSKKMEVILSGGTWECYPQEERDRFIVECYYAANNFGIDKDKMPEMKSILEEQKINETAEYRIIGMTLETRPDFISKKSILDYRRYGVTRIQIGVQHYDDVILKKINRGCYTKDTIKAIRLLKQAGYKVVVHLMPDLPGSSPESDIWMFEEAINNPDLQFDDLKIYPTAICKSHDDDHVLTSVISEWYDQGKYTPYAEKNLQDLITVISYYLANVNPWVRIQRCIRDIPEISIEAGYKKKSNLAQIIKDQMKLFRNENENIKTYEIRSMEVRNDSKKLDYEPRLVVRKYEASKGIEYHISIEVYKENIYEKTIYYLWKVYQTMYNSILHFIFHEYFPKMYFSGSPTFNNCYVGLFGFLRLRIDKDPGGDFIPEINNSALIREVHVYGTSLSVSGKDNITPQHKGYGKLLVKTAQDIAADHKLPKISVISGIGTKEYYKNKCGFKHEGTYMTKDIEIIQFFRDIDRFFGIMFSSLFFIILIVLLN
jgi:ELP3 family radical SAM enzyme/protein acetyltransferase